MRIRLLNLLLFAALAVAASRLWQFLRESPPALPAVAATTSPETALTRREQPAAAAAIRPETYDVIVARDLFSPTRGVILPAPVAEAKPAPKPQPPPKLTLYGVVIVDGEKSAYLQEGAQESRPQKVHENGRFAGGTVGAIRPDGLTFIFNGTDIVVPLRTPKEGVAAPPAAEQGADAQRTTTPPVFPRRARAPGANQAQMPAPLNQMPATMNRIPAAPGVPRFPGDALDTPPAESTEGVPAEEENAQESPFGGMAEEKME